MSGVTGPRWRRSLAGRILVLTSLAVGISVAVVALASYFTVRTQAMRTLDETLRERATAAARTNLITELSAQAVPSEALAAADVRIILVNANTGEALSADNTNDMRVSKIEYEVAAGTRPWSARTLNVGEDRFRMVAVRTQEPGEALVLAQSMSREDRMLQRMGLVSGLFGLAGVVLAGVAGWLVARSGLRPVRRLTDAAEKVARTGNLQPIPVESDDEIGRLATSFNKMLTTLDESRRQQKQLVADAGHELRTPLTSLRTNLDLLAQADGSGRMTPEARADLIGDVRAQITELTTLIGDLVELARDTPTTSEDEPVEFASVVQQAVVRVRRRAPGLTFDVATEPWWVVGDRASLERAVTNLLDNAAKWSPPGGTVRATLSEGALEVTDQGPGIDDKDLPHVFERFFRSAESRGMPGSGLGLSIVRSVAERHGGSAMATRAPSGGAALRFTVPGAATPPETASPVTSPPTSSGHTRSHV